METLNDLLNWLTGAEAGAFVVVMFVMAWAFEGLEWFQKLSSRFKGLLTLSVSSVLAVGAVWLQGRPDIVAAIEPFFKPLMYIALAWLAKQGAHFLNPKRAENKANPSFGGFREVG